MGERYSTVKGLFTDICDAIREKDGTTSLIRHQDIPGRISAISGSAEGVKSPFYTRNGNTIKIEDMVVSNFDVNNAIYLPTSFTPGESKWEIQVKFETPDAWVHDYTCLFASTIYRSCIMCDIEKNNGVMSIWFGIPVGNANQWNYGAYAEDYILAFNTWYWLRAIFDGEKYTINLSTDGKNFEEVIRIDYSGQFYSPERNNQFMFGGNASFSNKIFDGSIDLKETYIKIGEEIWWGRENTQ